MDSDLICFMSKIGHAFVSTLFYGAENRSVTSLVKEKFVDVFKKSRSRISQLKVSAIVSSKKSEFSRILTKGKSK